MKMVLYTALVQLLVKTAQMAANTPSVKHSYQPEMPESVKRLKRAG